MGVNGRFERDDRFADLEGVLDFFVNLEEFAARRGMAR